MKAFEFILSVLMFQENNKLVLLDFEGRKKEEHI